MRANDVELSCFRALVASNQLYDWSGNELCKELWLEGV